MYWVKEEIYRITFFNAEKTVTGNSDLPSYEHRATCVCYNTAGYTPKY
jgi:hypothetical protein